MATNEITINGITYSLEKDIANKGCLSCDLDKICNRNEDCLTSWFIKDTAIGYIFKEKKKEKPSGGKLFTMMDKSDSILVLDKIESIKIGGNYPFLGLFDLKVNGQTYSYDCAKARNDAYRKLWKAMEKIL